MHMPDWVHVHMDGVLIVADEVQFVCTMNIRDVYPDEAAMENFRACPFP